MLKRIHLLLWLGLVALFAGSPTASLHAQPVNCRVLAHTSSICITNMSPYPIVGVAASGHSGWSPTQWISVPGGLIMPGQTKVVTFNTWGGGCYQYVYVHTSNPTHPTHSVYANVCRSYKLTIGSW